MNYNLLKQKLFMTHLNILLLMYLALIYLLRCGITPHSISFSKQPIWEKENPEFRPAALCLKIDLATHPACDRRVE